VLNMTERRYTFRYTVSSLRTLQAQEILHGITNSDKESTVLKCGTVNHFRRIISSIIWFCLLHVILYRLAHSATLDYRKFNDT